MSHECLMAGPLRYIEKLEYRGHVIKIARRADTIKFLIYSANEILATDIVEAPLSDYEVALEFAKAKVDQMI